MIDKFPDRRARLFGREPDIDHLIDRTRQPGLTAVVARPLMGKTWTLTEVARRLLDEGRHLVGYHEATGGESSHLLHAVSNLYAHWLSDSTMRQQAISLWECHKEGLVPRASHLVGSIIEKVGGLMVPESVAGIVRSAFDGLAEAQKNFLTGGLQLPALPYDQALSLTRLVLKVSGRRVVLILDAWEKSPSLRAELGTLEGILKHADDWEHAHVLLAVRHPEINSTELDEEAYRRAGDLCRISRAAELYELPLMNQTDSSESQRIVTFVRDRVPAAVDQSDESILETIDGYPGVLDFWTSGSATQSWSELKCVAHDAQALRYLELDHLLNELPEGARAVAARLAFFPRLDAERWALFRDILIGDQSVAVLDALVDDGVLNDGAFPSYGHDTRHVAARQWFVKHWRPLVRRIAEACIEALAARVTGLDSASQPYIETLFACSEAGRDVRVDSALGCLLDAAQSLFGKSDALFHSSFDASYPMAVRRNPLCAPLISLALDNRGLMKFRREDYDGAIADQTVAAELPGVRVNQVARAINNRAVARLQRGDDVDGAITDWTAVIELPNAPADQVAQALHNRGFTREQLGDEAGRVDDYTALIHLPNAPTDAVAGALYNRAIIRGQHGDSEGAIADYTAVIQLADAPDDDIAKALCNRGILKGQGGDYDGEIADYSAALRLANAPVDQRAMALCNRGARKNLRGDNDGAIADYTTALGLPGVSSSDAAYTLCNRAVAYRDLGDRDGELADYTAIIALPNAPALQLARAFTNRGIIKSIRGDIDGAISDYTACLQLSGAPAEDVARALCNRGIARGMRDDYEGAIADCTAVVELPDAPLEQLAKALNGRGANKIKRGDYTDALTDLTKIIELTHAPATQVAWAFVHRGVARQLNGDPDGAAADYGATLELAGAPADAIEVAGTTLCQMGIAR